jgi:hypothetical protein
MFDSTAAFSTEDEFVALFEATIGLFANIIICLVIYSVLLTVAGLGQIKQGALSQIRHESREVVVYE